MNSTKAAPQVPVAVSPPELWRLEFERRQPQKGEQLDADEVSINTGIALTRLGPAEIGVEFAFEAPNLPVGRISVAYRAKFKLEATEEVDDLEETLRSISARLAPSTLYPFVREAVASTFARAGFPPLMLPILDFGKMYSPEEMEVPAYDDEE